MVNSVFFRRLITANPNTLTIAGKTHLAIAFGREACRRSHKVKFLTASQLVNTYDLRLRQGGQYSINPMTLPTKGAKASVYSSVVKAFDLRTGF